MGEYRSNALCTYENQTSKEKASLIKNWEEIEKSKVKFFTKNEDPRNCSYIDNEVAQSWIRSQAFGVSPFTEIIGKRLDSESTAIIMEQNRQLIEIVHSLFEDLKLKELINTSRYALYLFDKNGVLLLHAGAMVQVIPNKDSVAGIIWNEETMGTCAHILSTQLKRPIHLIGPEHYCIAFHNSNASAAPILDENGKIVATLVLSQHLEKPPEDYGKPNLISNTFGLITAMAAAVENKIKLQNSYNYLKHIQLIQETAFAFVDEGIITVDEAGKIIHANAEAARIFKLRNDEIENRYINEIMTNKSELIKSISNIGSISDEENAYIEETIFIGKDDHKYVVYIRPVLVPDSKEMCGAVLKLNSANPINPQINSRPGATASYNFESLTGESKEFKKAVALGKRFARSPENVLLIGESGTGKELFAQSIHNEHRPHGPFIVVNCAAVPRNLIESELFGYEGGSFTGAERSGRPGKIELAHGGTLFLDEIGDMPFDLQAVLLRVLEDKQVMRIGGRYYKNVDFRVIAATNKNLHEMVIENQFREDLYFRLSILSINLPPLRSRRGDIEILANYFIQSYCRKIGRKACKISPAAKAKLNEYDWPGNVRQLENAIIYAINTTQSEVIEAKDLPAAVLGEVPVKGNDYKNVENVYNIAAMEKVVIENALFKTKNNITKAAELLGIGKSTLYRKLKDYNIDTNK